MTMQIINKKLNLTFLLINFFNWVTMNNTFFFLLKLAIYIALYTFPEVHIHIFTVWQLYDMHCKLNKYVLGINSKLMSVLKHIHILFLDQCSYLIWEQGWQIKRACRRNSYLHAVGQFLHIFQTISF